MHACVQQKGILLLSGREHMWQDWHDFFFSVGTYRGTEGSSEGGAAKGDRKPGPLSTLAPQHPDADAPPPASHGLIRQAIQSM